MSWEHRKGSEDEDHRTQHGKTPDTRDVQHMDISWEDMVDKATNRSEHGSWIALSTSKNMGKTKKWIPSTMVSLLNDICVALTARSSLRHYSCQPVRELRATKLALTLEVGRKPNSYRTEPVNVKNPKRTGTSRSLSVRQICFFTIYT